MNKSMLILLLASIACVSQTAIPAAKTVVNIPTEAKANFTSYECTVYGTDWLNVRSEADPNALVVDELKDSDTITVIGEAVQAVDGGVWLPIVGGWVNARYVCNDSYP